MDRITAARVFVETVGRGSVSRAAEHLDMSRAMASRYVSSLEDWANARLLHRTTRRLSLTEAGKLMLPLCAQMLAVERAVGEVAIPDDVPRGTLRVAAPTIFSEMYLVGAIAEFLVLNPQVSIDLQTSDRTVDLVEERIDIALRISQQLEPNLISRRLGACRSVLCASPGYFERRGVPSSLTDIKHHDCLTYAFFGDGEWRLDDGSGFQPIKINGRFRTDETLEIRRAALEGLGIAILPEFAVRGDIANGRLRTVLENCRVETMYIHAIYTSRQHLPLATRRLIDFLGEHLRRWMSK
jgi:DNA-binding transcriptional LysR family regulator